MSVFPQSLSALSPLPVICPLSANALPGCASAIIASAAWPTANKAIFVPFRIAVIPYVAKRLWLLNGATVTGTVDIGIYTKDFTRMVSTKAQTQSGANSIQQFTIDDTLLAPGTYYMAIAASATTDNAFRIAPWGNASLLGALGVLEQTSAIPLPALATPVRITSIFLPMFGLASRITV